jgi:putative ABC transport system ATP-binding protein
MVDTELQPLIKLDGVTKVFLTDEVETHALASINVQIGKGEYVAIAGPSGCGKSTLLSILGLLDSPSEGSYLLNGRPVAELPASERARVRNREIGFIFELQPDRRSHRVRERGAAAHLSRDAHRGTQAAGRGGARTRRDGAPRETPPSQLSGGQRGASPSPGPSPASRSSCGGRADGNLDSRSGEAVMDLLKELHQSGATICMVTHDPRYARHADRSIHLFDGRVVEEPMELASVAP